MKILILGATIFIIVLNFSGCGSNDSKNSSSDNKIKVGTSVNSSGIQPYGKFNFGDSITPTIKNICTMKGITLVTVDNSVKYSFNEFCEAPIEKLKKVLSKSYSIRPLNNKYIKNIAKGGTSIKIEPLNIKGVPFSLRLRMDLYGEKNIIGAYLMSKKDTLTVNTRGNQLLVPLLLKRAELKPLEKDIFKMKKEEIYNILKHKYSNLFSKLPEKKQKTYDFYKSFSLKDQKGARIDFDSNEINYDFERGLEKQFIKKYMSYIKTQQSTSVSDSSDDL